MTRHVVSPVTSEQYIPSIIRGPLLLVDRQMALVRNSDIHCTGSSIVYMLILDCLDN